MSLLRRLKPSHLDHILDPVENVTFIYTAHDNQITIRNSEYSYLTSILRFDGRIIDFCINHNEKLLIVIYKQPVIIPIFDSSSPLILAKFNNKLYKQNVKPIVLESDGAYAEHSEYENRIFMQIFDIRDISNGDRFHHLKYSTGIPDFAPDKILCHGMDTILIGRNTLTGENIVLLTNPEVGKNVATELPINYINAKILGTKLIILGYGEESARNTLLRAVVYSTNNLTLRADYCVEGFYVNDFIHIVPVNDTTIILHDENELGIFLYNPANYTMYLRNIYGAQRLKSVASWKNFLVYSAGQGISLHRINQDYSISFESFLERELYYHFGEYGFMSSIIIKKNWLHCIGLNDKYYGFSFAVEEFINKLANEKTGVELLKYNPAFRDIGQHIISQFFIE